MQRQKVRIVTRYSKVHYKRPTLEIIYENAGCLFYCKPEDGTYRRIPRRMQAFCAIKLPRSGTRKKGHLCIEAVLSRVHKALLNRIIDLHIYYQNSSFLSISFGGGERTCRLITGSVSVTFSGLKLKNSDSDHVCKVSLLTELHSYLCSSSLKRFRKYHWQRGNWKQLWHGRHVVITSRTVALFSKVYYHAACTTSKLYSKQR